jgi:hypothetical protein
MTQLAAAVDAAEHLWELDSLPETEYVKVDDEIVRVAARFESSTYSLTGEVTPPKIRVERGRNGTTAASHAENATLEILYAPSTVVTNAEAFTVDLTTVPANVGITEVEGITITGPAWVQAFMAVTELVEGVIEVDNTPDLNVWALGDDWTAPGVHEDVSDAVTMVSGLLQLASTRWRLFLDTPTGGTYTLTITASNAPDPERVATTAAIAHDADAATIKAAIEAVEYEPGQVLVSQATVTADGADFTMTLAVSANRLESITVNDSLDNAVPTITEEVVPATELVLHTTLEGDMFYLPAGETRRIGTRLASEDAEGPAQPAAGTVDVVIILTRP